MEEYKVISDYIFDLRVNQGFEYYTKEEMLEDYIIHINRLVSSTYNERVDEYGSDWEYWDIIFDLDIIISINQLFDKPSMQDFMNKYKIANELLLENLIPVKMEPGLPWYCYSVLKKAGKIYADDVKLVYGIDIEVGE